MSFELSSMWVISHVARHKDVCSALLTVICSDFAEQHLHHRSPCYPLFHFIDDPMK